MFESLNIKRCYRSKKDNLDYDFFVPLLKYSVIYYRGVGYFSLKNLLNLSAGIIPYVKRGGIIKIITSVELSEEDIDLIKKGEEIAKNTIQNRLLREIHEEIEQSQKINLDLLTNLIAASIIQIRIAYIPDGGIYHEKVGYMEDEQGNCIWFNGSNNETYSGIKRNSESFMTLMSWKGDTEDIKEQKAYFENLWAGYDTDVTTYDFPEAAKLELLREYKESSSVSEAISKNEENNVPQEEKRGLYEYQEDAIEEFFSNGGVHFYEMATGTGKTFTAIKTIKAITERNIEKNLLVVIIVPQNDLQEQWRRELKKEDLDCFLFGGNSTNKDVDEEFNRAIIAYRLGSSLTIAVSTYDTYFSKLHNKLEKQKICKMFVVDEAHELSANQIAKLSVNYKYRLGLSATPQRHDKNETEQIISYFTQGKNKTFEYTIDQAIEKGFLSRYEYYPIYVIMGEENFEKYCSFTKLLNALRNQEEKDQEKITDVLNKRSLIVKKEDNKIIKLREMVSSKKYEFKNSVVYCGLGNSIETDEKIIDQVSIALYELGNYSVSHFTSKTEDRVRVLHEFENGYYDTLVAIKCFDQGVDVPKLDKIYIMASDSLKRQTIQRRGRVLRKCIESGKKLAYIYDMVLLPPNGDYGNGATALVRNELKRVEEYERLAENKDEIETQIQELIEEYRVDTEEYNEED